MKGLLKKSLVILSLSSMLMPISAFANEVIGSVISITGTASILRDGKMMQVYLKDSIRAGDTLITSANKANMRILLNDDTSILLAPDTDYTISNYIDDKKRSKIITNLTRGSVKIYSGDIVRKYPDIFTLSTVDGLVTLRQGIATIKKTSETTSVYAENTPNQDVIFNNKEVPSGHKAHVTTRHLIPDVTPISLYDRETLAADFESVSYQDIALKNYLENNTSNDFMSFRDTKKPDYSRIDQDHKLRVMDNFYYTVASNKGNSLENMESNEIVASLVNAYYDYELLDFAVPDIYTAPISAPITVANVRMGYDGLSVTYTSIAFTLDIFSGAITDAVLTGTSSSLTGTGQWTFDNDYDGRGDMNLGRLNIDFGGSATVVGTLASEDQNFSFVDVDITNADSSLSTPLIPNYN